MSQSQLSDPCRHRHQSDHDCEKLEVAKPRMAATQKLVRDIVGESHRLPWLLSFLEHICHSPTPAPYISFPFMEALLTAPV